MVQVKAKEDLLDRDSNTIVVPEGSTGTIVDTDYPPAKLRHKVDFSVNQSVVTKWVLPENILYVGGPVGLVQAVMEADQQTVSGASYPDVISATDVILGDELSALRSKVRIEFVGGLRLDIVADRNTGEQKFEFSYQSPT